MAKISFFRRSYIWLLVIILVLLIISFINNRIKNANFVYLQSEDSRIVEARKQALNEISYFIEVLNENSGNSKYDYSVKTDFVNNDKYEHMWVEVDSYKDGYFYGKLGSEPQIIKELTFHQPVKVKQEGIEDWLLHNKTTNTFEGGYSIKALGKWEELTR